MEAGRVKGDGGGIASHNQNITESTQSSRNGGRGWRQGG